MEGVRSRTATTNIGRLQQKMERQPQPTVCYTQG